MSISMYVHLNAMLKLKGNIVGITKKGVYSMELPLTSKLKKLDREQAISLHVPGHKNMTIGRLNTLTLTMDKTEITGLDDLHHPEDVIKESTTQLAKHPDYEAFLLVNGTTSGILSVIQAFSHIDGNILMMRNIHKSVLHALDLSQQHGQFCEMKQSLMTHQYVGPQLDNLTFQSQKLAVLTYPNYYGECFNIEETIKQLHEYNMPVLVDEAHGAHFDISGFPHSALNYDADYVVQSYHKTLPALTMGSVLYIHKNAPLKSQIIQYLSYFQTSSPSYLVMSSLELAQQFYDEYDSQLFFKKREQLIKALNLRQFHVKEVDDPLKLNISYQGYKGTEIQQWLEDVGVYPELADSYQVLLVLPLWHEQDTYPFESLITKIMNMPLPPTKNQDSQISQLLLSEGSYRPVRFEKTRWISLHEAENDVLAQHIVPYPPGIPMIFKGERITINMIKLIDKYVKTGITVEGIKDNKILVKDE